MTSFQWYKWQLSSSCVKASSTSCHWLRHQPCSSVVFARLSQCAPHLVHTNGHPHRASAAPCWVTSNMSNMPAYVIIRAATRQVLVPGGRIHIPGDSIILGPSWITTAEVVRSCQMQMPLISVNHGHGRDVSERWCVLLISSKCAHL